MITIPSILHKNNSMYTHAHTHTHRERFRARANWKHQGKAIISTSHVPLLEWSLYYASSWRHEMKALAPCLFYLWFNIRTFKHHMSCLLSKQEQTLSVNILLKDHKVWIII